MRLKDEVMELDRAFQAVAESVADLVTLRLFDIERYMDMPRQEERKAFRGLTETVGSDVADER